ncbi:hypothetical protein [Thermotoga sp. SG1]|uniref:hypothetical protein n=1 Tax=Thermotoga sp. SG1 TaxID=126739 RepID=UPI000C755D68|nr:hypothetical protein [Thermotoga sp. SG1]PLV57139.1 hypothetical protein AS006_02255 [Thermotoga sp. SG1]
MKRFFILTIVLSCTLMFSMWYTNVEKDLLTGSKKVFIYTTATDYDYVPDNFLVVPSLYIRIDYSLRKVEPYVYWDHFVGTLYEHTVVYKFDYEEPIFDLWNPSTNGEASFYSSNYSGKSVYQFLEKLMKTKTFVIRAWTYQQIPITAVFDVSGLSHIIEPYLEDIKRFSGRSL